MCRVPLRRSLNDILIVRHFISPIAQFYFSNLNVLYVPYRPLLQTTVSCGVCHSLCTCIVSVLFKTQCHGSILWKLIISHMCVEWHMLSTCDVFMCRSFFIKWCKRTVASPSTAMVDNRCPVCWQTQLAGEEESDELEDWVAWAIECWGVAVSRNYASYALAAMTMTNAFVKIEWQNA